jgi:hypothetical protein
MTRDEIMNMPAGREMDALIAKQITKIEGINDRGFKRDYDGSMVQVVPEYSTDIAAAWEVAENIELFQFMYLTKDIQWQIGNHGEYGFDEFTVIVGADTAPLVICRAALLAVMEDNNG